MTASVLGLLEITTAFGMAFMIQSFGGYALISGGILLLVFRYFVPDGLPSTPWLFSSKVHKARVMQVGIGAIFFGILMLIFWE